MLRRLSLFTCVLVAGTTAAAAASTVTWTCPEQWTGCTVLTVAGTRDMDVNACVAGMAPDDRPAKYRTATFVIDRQNGTYVNSLGHSGQMTPVEGFADEYIMTADEERASLSGRSKSVDDLVLFKTDDNNSGLYAEYRGWCRAQSTP